MAQASPLKLNSVLKQLCGDAAVRARFRDYLADRQLAEELDRWETAPVDSAASREAEEKLLPATAEFYKRRPEEQSLLSPRIGQTMSRAETAPAFKGGTFAETLDWLLRRVDDEHFLQETTFFIFGYRSFASSTDLLDRLVDISESADCPKERLFDFVRVWARLTPEFGSGLLQRLLTLKDLPTAVANDLKLQLLRAQQSAVSASDGPADALSPRGAGFGNTAKAEWTTTQFAEQITLLEAELFYRIRFEEFLGFRSSEEEKTESAPNLTKLAQRFNHVSHWVTTSVISAKGQKQRVHEIERFISMMDALRALHNYDGLMAVMSGLNNSAIARLKQDWEHVGADKKAAFAASEALMDSSRNFRAYREELDHVRSSSGIQGGVIPYIALHLRDIMMIEMGNPGEDGVIDWEKTMLFGNALGKLCFFQRHRYRLKPLEAIQNYLLLAEALNDDELHEKSLEIRPQDTNDAAAGSSSDASGTTSPIKGLKGSKIVQALSPRGKEKYQDLEPQTNPLFGKEDMKRGKSMEALEGMRMAPKSVSAADVLAGSPTNDSDNDNNNINGEKNDTKGKNELSAATSAEHSAATSPTTPVKSPRPGKVSMTTAQGEFLVIPTTDAESAAFAATQPGLDQLIAECEKRNIILPKSHYIRFFVVNHCNVKAALKNVIDYWGFYDSIGFKNIVTMDVSAALQSYIIAPPFSADWVDMDGCPLVIFRGNLWFEGDQTQPSLRELKMLLMWIGEDLAKSVPNHYLGFSFIMDMDGWTRKNFSQKVYTELLKMVQSCLPVRCKRCILLDVPKTFSASWKLITTALGSAFKKRMVISTRDHLLDNHVDSASLPTDLGGSLPAPDVNQYIAEQKSREQEAIVPPKADQKPELTPLADDCLEEDTAQLPGVYALRIKTRSNSTTGSPRQGPQKTLITKDKKLGFFASRKKLQQSKETE